MTNSSSTPRTVQQQARAYAKQHGVKYTEALRAVRAHAPMTVIAGSLGQGKAGKRLWPQEPTITGHPFIVGVRPYTEDVLPVVTAWLHLGGTPRLSHLLVCGGTGSGKSFLLETLVRQAAWMNRATVMTLSSIRPAATYSGNVTRYARYTANPPSWDDDALAGFVTAANAAIVDEQRQAAGPLFLVVDDYEAGQWSGLDQLITTVLGLDPAHRVHLIVASQSWRVTDRVWPAQVIATGPQSADQWERFGVVPLDVPKYGAVLICGGVPYPFRLGQGGTS